MTKLKLLLSVLLGTAVSACVADYPDDHNRAYVHDYDSYHADYGYYGDYDYSNWRDDDAHRHWQDAHGVWHYSYYDSRDETWHETRRVGKHWDDGRNNKHAKDLDEANYDNAHGRSNFNRPTEFGHDHD